MKEFHPIANLFPLMQGDELNALAVDIQANGLREAIWLHPDGRIIDGRNRYRACHSVGITPRFQLWDGKGSLVSFVVSLNLHRRHLTSSQRAVVALEVLPMLEQEAARRREETQGRPNKLSQKIAQVSREPKSTEKAAEILNTNRQYVSDAKKLKQEAPDLLEQVKVAEITIPQAKRELRKRNKPETPPLPTDKYRCLVIDPPWPMEKIEREVRPNQGEFLDYPTMSLDEIGELDIGSLADPNGCHVYLWTTQKYLRPAFVLFDTWGVRYQCLFTWVKPTGMTPFSWMYNTELVLFGRVGSLKLNRLGLKLSFDAPISKHSEKPQVFYDRVIQASPGPRLEMFARKKRDGFTVWGNEV